MERIRYAPNTQSPRKGIRRTIQRVTENLRVTAENESFYHSGNEWKQLHTDAEVESRRNRIAAAVPSVEFVPGIVHKLEAHDGALAGVKCSC